MPVHRTDSVIGGLAAAPARPVAIKTADRGFSAALRNEETKAEKPKAAGTAKAAEDTAKAAEKPRAPKGERTDPVEGHKYAEIVSGPRNGMFVNTSGNARDGRAFTLVERGGFHYHVYGTGRDRDVFRVADHDGDAPAGGAKPKV